MTVAYGKALAFTRAPDIEGGLSTNPLDTGGRTLNGLTQSEYNSWRARHFLAPQAVDLATDEEERALYFEDYWTPCRCEELPAGLGAAVFDMAINSGVVNATLTLQQALSVRQDGRIGVVTLTAAANAPDAVLKFLKARAGLIRDIVEDHPAQVTFLHGWINRLLLFQDAYFKGAFG